MIQRRGLRWAALAALAAATGCSSPNAANIQLRKDNQTLTSQVESLQRTNAGLAAQLQANQSSPTTPELPQSRLDQLFTVHGLEFGRLTGGFSPDGNPPDEMLKVYVVPTDDDGQPIKAAGSFQVELFDLAESQTRLGHWDFSTEQSRALWYGRGFLYTYVLDCPWQTIPQHEKLLLKTTFTDDLTGRKFESDKDIIIHPPAAAAAGAAK